jgi:hypothetical protein
MAMRDIGRILGTCVVLCVVMTLLAAHLVGA